MKNIKLFEIYSAKTLGLLYGHYPVPKSFNYYDFIDEDDMEEFLNSAVNAYYTIKELRKNGLLGYESLSDEGEVKNALLTLKGVETLKKDTMGEKLKQALKIGKEEFIKTAVGKILTAVTA